jgi:hypothetical protein
VGKPKRREEGKMIQAYQQIAPFQVRAGQLDIGGVINQILPILLLMLVFGMIVPLFRQLGKVFE